MSASAPFRHARPKRAVPSSASASSLESALRSSAAASHSSKKLRFDVRNPHALAADVDASDDEHDVFLEADNDVIGKSRSRRNAVELEGYDTDSSEEGFQRTHKSWAKESDKNKGKEKAKKDDEGDDDMFAEGGGDDDMPALLGDDGGDDDDAAGKGKKKVKFMKLEEIEGQEDFGGRDDESSESSGEDEDRMDEEADIDPEVGAGGKKKHAPKLDAFNMKGEMEEGRFDEAGNFVRKAREEGAVHDSWLQGVSKKDMKRAKEAMERRDREAREAMRRDDETVTSDVLGNLISFLERGETVLEALARLGGGRKKQVNKNKNQWRQKKKAAATGETETDGKGKGKGAEEEDPAEKRRKRQVEKITEAADILLSRGQVEIYDETREDLMRQYRRETDEDWAGTEKAVDQVAEKLWEYRWTDGRDADNTVYGPFKNGEMRGWMEHGFFGEGVEFRVKGGYEGWTRVPEF